MNDLSDQPLRHDDSRTATPQPIGKYQPTNTFGGNNNILFSEE